MPRVDDPDVVIQTGIINGIYVSAREAKDVTHPLILEHTNDHFPTIDLHFVTSPKNEVERAIL
jgi:hypothetical protein